jgi:hypothetical protein
VRRIPVALAPLLLASLVPACFGDDSTSHGNADASFGTDGGIGFDATSPEGSPGVDAAHEAGTDATTPSEAGVAESGADAPTDGPADSTVDAPADAPADVVGVPETGIEASVDAALTYPAVVEADTPLSYWRFGEASGTVAADQMGATAGTYAGGVTLGATGAIAGDSDTAATFDGSSGYVDMGTGFAFGGTAAMSYEVWVKPNAADAAARRFVSKETNDGAREGFLMAYAGSGVDADSGAPTGLMSFERWGSGGVDSVDEYLTVGVYQHVVVTYDGATMSYYLNGVLATSTASTRVIKTLADPFRVATYSDSPAAADCFGGTIDEVAVYDHALSAARVALHYQVGSGQ